MVHTNDTGYMTKDGTKVVVMMDPKTEVRPIPRKKVLSTF
jgi:hypothetical protein